MTATLVRLPDRMSSRAHRKALPLDPTGIHWGTGSSACPERHESGTVWEPDEWKRFVTWALENGAQCVESHFDGENGPARVWKDGYEAWYLNGLRHRENGPAVVCPDGREEWWQHGQLHREDGPAIGWPDRCQAWWLDGQRYTDGTFSVRA
jgi:hypothetical protein